MNPSPQPSGTAAPAGRRRGLIVVAVAAAAAAVVSMMALSQDTAVATDTAKKASVTGLVPVTGGAPALGGAVAPVTQAAQGVTGTLPDLSSAGKVAEGVVPQGVVPNGKAAAPAAKPQPHAASCAGLNSAVAVFMQHFYAAHLEPSLGQQIADITNIDQYVKTHTVMVENMIKPLVGGSDAALSTFLAHVYAAHLEASPGQQVADITALDQYVKTHTVMIENMVKPLSGDVSGC